MEKLTAYAKLKEKIVSERPEYPMGFFEFCLRHRIQNAQMRMLIIMMGIKIKRVVNTDVIDRPTAARLLVAHRRYLHARRATAL